MRKTEENRFREFAREQSAALRRTGYLLCGDWHLADDLTQQTLIKLYRAWPRLERDAAPVSYARKVLLRCWLDERRRPWRRAERRDGEIPDGADPATGPVEAHELVSLRAALFRSLDELGPRQRAVLVLRYFESLSITETAAALGCTEGTVKSQAARGLAALRTSVDVRAEDLTKESR
ncbi:RNA polymerase subunit sigma-24 [Actinophytocola xinjiangensis]|uniref:RNA polymerase subunit sigma-24 n=1 Tax=Actinophytocola xinjiangensis TaxID=485602 RepID=A0A7Z1AYQ4_9PSEU|nr:SigE family RNA polymerase sigma factor [Actinophytocola xinjiangensis]OLF09478.1 RNA polymerase subunit sigma-24 [Actinophytocola xinjiangensis]